MQQRRVVMRMAYRVLLLGFIGKTIDQFDSQIQ